MESSLLFCYNLGAEYPLKAHVNEELIPAVVLYRLLVNSQDALSEWSSNCWGLALEGNSMTLMSQSSFFFMISDMSVWSSKCPGQYPKSTDRLDLGLEP